MSRWILAFLSATSLFGCSSKKPELHLFCWGDYVDEEVIRGFSNEFHCKVTLDKYGSAQEMMAKLLAGGSGYDLVWPSDEFVSALIQRGMLQKLDASKIPNRKHLSPKYLGRAFDPNNEYSLPYFWGTTGIAYNKEKIRTAPTSWGDLWNPDYKNRVTLVEDAREGFAAALRRDGKSINETDPAALGQAKERLLALKPNLLGFDSEPREKLISGDVWIAQAFSGDALQARNANPAIDYVIPKEGGSIWIDSMAIPKGAKNPELAHAFLNYVLRPDVSAKLANFNGYANPNEAAREGTNREILQDPIAYPPDEILGRCEFLQPFADADKRRIEDLWTEVRSR